MKMFIPFLSLVLFGSKSFKAHIHQSINKNYLEGTEPNTIGRRYDSVYAVKAKFSDIMKPREGNEAIGIKKLKISSLSLC